MVNGHGRASYYVCMHSVDEKTTVGIRWWRCVEVVVLKPAQVGDLTGTRKVQRWRLVLGRLPRDKHASTSCLPTDTVLQTNPQGEEVYLADCGLR